MALRKENLRERSYNTIKKEIVTLKLPPGSYIDREKIQKNLNIGLTPLREALFRLEAENLVTSIAKKGFYVKDLNIQSIKELLENRMYLERYVGFLAIDRITEKSITGLEKIALQMKSLAESGDEYELVMKDTEFHKLIVRATSNSQLEKIMNLIYNEALRVWFISHYEDLTESVKMHFKTIEVLKKRDWVLLEKDIIHHNVVFRERVNNYLKSLLSESQLVISDFKMNFPLT